MKAFVDLKSNKGVVKFQNKTVYAYDSLNVKTDLLDENLQAAIALVSPAYGSVFTNVASNLKNQSLKGNVKIKDVNTKAAQQFVDLDKINGLLNGNILLGGTLLKPSINGNIDITDLLATDSGLPVQVKNGKINIQFSDNQSNIKGNLVTNGGNANITGNVNWQNGLNAKVNLQGQNLEVNTLDYGTVTVSPDMNVVMNNGALSVQGTVDIPRGNIEIADLPPSSVSVSSDTVMVGQKKEKSSPMKMNIIANIGSDNLQLNAYGLNAQVAGKLHIKDNLATSGELLVPRGKFKAYGQNLELRPSRIIFVDVISNPSLDIQAVRNATDGTVAGVKVQGRVKKMKATLFSEPTLDQNNTLSYLLLGKGLDEGGGSESNYLSQAMLAIGLAGGENFSNKLTKDVGLDALSFDSSASDGDVSVGATVQLSSKLSARFGYNIFQQADVLSMKYEASRKFYIEAVSGIVSSIDAFYKRDF
jgi:translocation and assembly module TamB